MTYSSKSCWKIGQGMHITINRQHTFKLQIPRLTKPWIRTARKTKEQNILFLGDVSHYAPLKWVSQKSSNGVYSYRNGGNPYWRIVIEFNNYSSFSHAIAKTRLLDYLINGLTNRLKNKYGAMHHVTEHTPKVSTRSVNRYARESSREKRQQDRQTGRHTQTDCPKPLFSTFWG